MKKQVKRRDTRKEPYSCFSMRTKIFPPNGKTMAKQWQNIPADVMQTVTASTLFQLWFTRIPTSSQERSPTHRMNCCVHARPGITTARRTAMP